jgi:hypothetical protein
MADDFKIMPEWSFYAVSYDDFVKGTMNKPSPTGTIVQ